MTGISERIERERLMTQRARADQQAKEQNENTKMAAENAILEELGRKLIPVAREYFNQHCQPILSEVAGLLHVPNRSIDSIFGRRSGISIREGTLGPKGFKHGLIAWNFKEESYGLSHCEFYISVDSDGSVGCTDAGDLNLNVLDGLESLKDRIAKSLMAPDPFHYQTHEVKERPKGERQNGGGW